MATAQNTSDKSQFQSTTRFCPQYIFSFPVALSALLNCKSLYYTSRVTKNNSFQVFCRALIIVHELNNITVSSTAFYLTVPDFRSILSILINHNSAAKEGYHPFFTGINKIIIFYLLNRFNNDIFNYYYNGWKPSMDWKVHKREIFMTEFFTSEWFFWVGDMRTQAKKSIFCEVLGWY